MKRTALLIAVLTVTPALAGPREDVYSSSLRCAAITDDRTWLECYYGAAQPLRGQLQLPAAPASQTSLIPPAIAGAAMPAPAMGAPTAFQPRPAPKPGPVGRTLNYLTGGEAIVSRAQVKSYDPGPGGFVVTLDNGQVWKQSDDQQRMVRWRGNVETHHVSVWKGALNTFNLGFDDEGDRYKVRRLK